jgi:carboxypeptidase D
MLQNFLLLLLSSPIGVVAQSAADYYVKSLPGQPDGPFLKMHAG